ncbi:MAG: hypothetical protein FWG34_06335 [Oscillospiraceae bacterium]|nr:hypothetical protein [Oscillospiraceae bacterium]
MKKIISALFLLLAACWFVSCSKDDSGPGSGVFPENSEAAAETATKEEFDIYEILPAADFGENVFNAYVPPNFYSPVDIGFTAEEQIGEKFNDEVYLRNRRLEDRYNFKFGIIYGSDPWSSYADLTKIMKGGDNSYDVFFTHIWSNVATFASEGMVKDWQEVPYADLGRPWWNQSSINAMKIANKVFYAAGSFQVQDVVVLIANKAMVADFALESPYKLVTEGRWTLDTVGEMAKAVTLDLDNNGKFDESDRYGIEFGGSWQLSTFVYACGGQITEIDGGGVPSLVLKNEKMVSIFDRLSSFVHDGNKIYLFNGNTEETWNRPHIGVQSGRVLLTEYDLLDCGELRQIDAEYMILPLPKYDEAQPGYRSISMTGTLCIPRYIENERADMVGIIMEAMAADGYKNIIPLYYNVVLKSKYAQDEESIEMIDIILNSVVYDLGFCYNDIGLPGYDFNAWIRDKKNYVSTIEKSEDKMKAALEKVYNKIIEQYG